jgi:hypothetical protein
MAIAARVGTPTLHGPVLSSSSNWGKLSWDAFRALAFEGATPTFANPPGADDRLVQRSGRIRTFGPGKASGRLLGGNLTVLTAMMGTPYLPDFNGAILFLEDVDEGPHRIDRMLTQLALGGILRRVAGVVFGQCTRCTETSPMLGGFTVSDVLDQHLTPLGIPRSRALCLATSRTSSACRWASAPRLMQPPGQSGCWSRRSLDDGAALPALALRSGVAAEIVPRKTSLRGNWCQERPRKPGSKQLKDRTFFTAKFQKGPMPALGLTELSSGSALSHAGSAANGNFR